VKETIMEAKAIEPGEFREEQRKQWDGAAAGWRRWSGLIDGATSGIGKRMVELARVGPGSRVLDVAAGYGEPSLPAARAAGPNGAVVATDISAEMLQFGRERAAAAGIENVEFLESGAIALEFPERSFDAALSRFGIIFEPDAEGAAARVRSFLKPGSWMAISSWGTPDRAPFIAVPLQATMKRFGIDPPPPGAPGPLSRPTQESLAGLLQGGGFSDVQVEEAEVTFEWESPEGFTDFIREIAPPVSSLIAQQPEQDQAAAWDAITEAIRDYAGDDERVSLDNLVLIAAGRA